MRVRSQPNSLTKRNFPAVLLEKSYRIMFMGHIQFQFSKICFQGGNGNRIWLTIHGFLHLRSKPKQMFMRRFPHTIGTLPVLFSRDCNGNVVKLYKFLFWNLLPKQIFLNFLLMLVPLQLRLLLSLRSFWAWLAKKGMLPKHFLVSLSKNVNPMEKRSHQAWFKVDMQPCIRKR